MGWTFYNPNSGINTYADEKREICRMCTWETETRNHNPVHASKVGSVWYVAVKIEAKNADVIDDSVYVTDSDGSITFCAVFLTRRSGGEWGYKDMTETCGPNAAQAPLSLLAKLSDLKDPDNYAAKWRESCRAYAANTPPRLQNGDRIRTQPIKLTNGALIQNFTVRIVRNYASRAGRMEKFFDCADNGSTYTLQRRHLVGLEIVKRGIPA